MASYEGVITAPRSISLGFQLLKDKFFQVLGYTLFLSILPSILYLVVFNRSIALGLAGQNGFNIIAILQIMAGAMMLGLATFAGGLYFSTLAGRDYHGDHFVEHPWKRIAGRAGTIILTALLAFLILLVVYIVFAVLMALGTYLVTAAGGGNSAPSIVAGIVTVFFAFVMLIIIIAFMLRLSFIFPIALFEDGRAGWNIKESFRLTRGRGWRILGTMVMLGLISYALFLLVYYIRFRNWAGVVQALTSGASVQGLLGTQIISASLTGLLAPLYWFAISFLYLDARMVSGGNFSNLEERWTQAGSDTTPEPS